MRADGFWTEGATGQRLGETDNWMALWSCCLCYPEPLTPGALVQNLAEAASDGKSLLLDSGVVVQGRGARQGACCELLMLLVSVPVSQAVGMS